MQGPFELGCCPVTMKEIEFRSEWSFDFGSYKAEFGLMEPAFAITRVSGTPTIEALQTFYDVFEKAITDKGWPEFHTLSDYSELKGITSQVRDFNLKRVQKFNRLKTMNVYGASTALKVNIHLGRFLNKHKTHVNLCSNYSDALHRARNNLSVDLSLKQPTEKWIVESKKGKATIELIGENVVCTNSLGEIDDEFVEAYLVKMEEALRWMTRINGSSVHYRILDASSVGHINMSSRKKLTRGLEALGLKYEIVNGYIIGKSFFVRIGFQLARAILNYKVYSVASVVEALNHIRYEAQKDSQETKETHEFQTENFWVSSLLNDLAQVDWAIPGSAFSNNEKLLPSNWLPFYDAIEIIKSDVDNLILEREKRNEELSREKERSARLAEDLQIALRTSEEMRRKAEKTAKIKEEFLANMSHEIRTPLNGIMGMGGLLLETDLNEDQLDMLTTMQNSSEDLLRILNDILDFSKLEANKLVIELRVLSLKALVNDVVKLLNHQAEKKFINILVDYEMCLRDFVISDEIRIRQVLLNLISNAIKFTNHGNVKVVVQSDHSSDEVVIIVRDTGIGISKENTLSLFESFSQADNTITRKYGGTGLGLSICKKILPLLGGSIEVKSELGIGSEFTARFKAKDGSLRGVADKEVPNFDKSKKVLLVEDNSVNQKVFARLIKGFGLEVDLAINGAIGFERAMSKRYDIILMDLQMPILDGISAAKKIRTHEKEMNKIIALTANALNEHKKLAFDAGMNDFLTKPLSRDQLIRCFNKWLT